MWDQLTIGEDAKEAFPIVGRQWLGEKSMSWEQYTLLARFLVGNTYMGSTQLLRNCVTDVFCPISGYELNRMHIVKECRCLEVERFRIEEAIPSEFRWDLS